jgi:hypothetical protein
MLKKLSTYIDFGLNSEGNSKGYTNYQNNKTADGFDFLHLINAWSDIAGNKLSEHTIPLKNQNGTLTILSNHSAFANEMKFMEIPLKKKIFQKFPALEKNIKNILFIVDSTHFEKQYELLSSSIKKSKNQIQMPHPFSPIGKKLKLEAKELFKNIEDVELRDSFETLYIQSKFNLDK